MTKIAASNHGQPPDAIYAGLLADNTTGSVLKAKVAAMGDNTRVKLIGTEGLEDPAIIDDAGAQVADGLYTTITGLPLDQLPPAGQAFYADYAKAYGQAGDSIAVYGYEAMNAALKAIEDVCAAGGDPADRPAVRDAVFNIQDFDGALGTWSFDANGDTSLTDMTFDQVVDGKFTPVAVSAAGQIMPIQ